MLEWILPIASAIGCSLVTYLFTRRRNKAELTGTELDNLAKTVDLYRKMLDDVREEVGGLLETVDEMERERDILKNKLKKADLRIVDQQKEIVKLQSIINKLR